MKKKLILSIGALGLVFAATPVISCSATSNNYYNESKIVRAKLNNYYNESKIVRANEISWSDKIDDIPSAQQYIWDADKTKTMKSTIDFMNDKMGLYLPKPISELSPYDFANFILRFFEQNGGGTIGLIMKWNGESQNILLQLEQPLVSIIRSFDGPPQITSNTTRYNGTVLSGILSIGAKLATGSDPIQALTGFWNLFGDYGKVIFGTDSVLKLLANMNTNIMLKNIVSLLEPFPASALTTFPTFFGLFKTMAQEMSSNTIGQEWAKSNNISEEFANIDKNIIKLILT